MHHSSSIISKKAEIDDDVKIGAYAIVEEGVKISRGCEIANHAQILSGVEIGENCFIGHGAVLGSDPQDRSFDKKINSGVKIGKNNILREHVTIHRGSKEGNYTTVGENNMFMNGSHLGHDVSIGNNNNIASFALFGGFVSMGSNCFIGGGAAFHQFIRIGDGVIVQGHGGFSQDVAPFVIGCNINEISGLNSIGMRRMGVDIKQRRELKEAFKEIFIKKVPPKTILKDIDWDSLTVYQDSKKSPKNQLKRNSLSEKGELNVLKTFYEFFKAPSQKGICLRFR